VDNLETPARSLQYLTDNAEGLQDGLKRGFAMGIKIAKLDLEKSLEDYKVTQGGQVGQGDRFHLRKEELGCEREFGSEG
jgi:hypothetical protein